MAPYLKMYIHDNHLALLILIVQIICKLLKAIYGLKQALGHGFNVLVLSFFVLALLKARLTILCLFIMITFLL